MLSGFVGKESCLGFIVSWPGFVVSWSETGARLFAFVKVTFPLEVENCAIPIVTAPVIRAAAKKDFFI